MNKRIHILLFVCMLGLLLPTAVSRTLLAAKPPTLVSEVELDGPKVGIVGLVYTYTAVAISANPPVTYVWQAAGQTITHTGDADDLITITWPHAQMHAITVTASDTGGTAEASRMINVLPATNPLSDGIDIYANPRAPRAIIATSNGSIFGPYICTSYGDPFSPLNNPYVTAPHTYRYRIQIPASYPHDIVRVELFDPDSINRVNQSGIIITRTNAAIEAGLPPVTTGNCTTNRKDYCFIATGEFSLAQNGVLELDEVNPYWFWRIDENRGAGASPGNGTCGQPATYSPLFNTNTHFQLYYEQDNGGVVDRIFLASYTGQTGDGVRDNGDHDTDMRWVSPGAAVSSDQPIFVPTDVGSPGDFEIDLSSETPGIVTDPNTGDRYLYLDVTSLSGASENGFEIWAGPAVYTSTAPSNVNLRNLHLLNNLAAQDSYGVTVYALDYFINNSNLSYDWDVPLAYLPPEEAGNLVTVSTFDSDSGVQPPITFFFDTVPTNEWSMTFGQSGIPDPDGEERNCIPGTANGCNNTWVAPPYQLTLPANFPGGRLMAHYRSGFGDTFVWEVQNHPEPTSITMTGPVTGTADVPYTFQTAVASPTIVEPLTYIWQTAGQPPIVHNGYLTDAVELSWPFGGIKTITVTAENRYGVISATHQISITGPNGPDLTIIGQPQLQTPLPLGANLPVSFTVTIENVGGTDVDNQFLVDIFIDPTVVLTTGIPVSESNGYMAVPTLAAGESRVVTITAPLGFTAEPFTHTVYAWVDSLEQVIESDETNNVSEPLTVTDVHPLLEGVTLSGPELGLTGETYTFTAVVTPSTITDPITYTWLVDAAPPLTQTNGTAVAAPFGWAVPGTYTLTITATHGFNAVSDTHTIVITDTPISDLDVIGRPQLLTPHSVQPQQPVSFTVTIANEGNIPITGSFRADIFLDPAVVLTDSIPITQSAAFVLVNGLGVGETAVLTFTVPSGFDDTGLFEVYAMVDSTQVVTEVDETNNISDPLFLHVFWQLYLPVIRKP